MIGRCLVGVLEEEVVVPVPSVKAAVADAEVATHPPSSSNAIVDSTSSTHDEDGGATTDHGDAARSDAWVEDPAFVTKILSQALSNLEAGDSDGDDV